MSTGPNVLILGANSDIAKELVPHFKRAGWGVHPWARGGALPVVQWDLCLVALGSVAPVGPWWKQKPMDCIASFDSNFQTPLRLLTQVWACHNEGASVCFMAGANPNKPMAGYVPYATGKMALLKMCEHMDHETPDAKFFALGPGTVLTKIHAATRRAGWNNPALALKDHEGENREQKVKRIFDCLMWCHEQRKDVIGGRNVCVSDPWDSGFLAEALRRRPDMYKLRRMEP